ncbi:MAG: hypothetical protein QOE89_2890, partial [Pseudonocardiales bacterium]|nr:hypothetical protein [Pseudonocardiales bacterium]
MHATCAPVDGRRGHPQCGDDGDCGGDDRGGDEAAGEAGDDACWAGEAAGGGGDGGQHRNSECGADLVTGHQGAAGHPGMLRRDAQLRASGETARKRDPSTLTLLTPMELQIAQLVAHGMSNKEAAAQCWISARTVAFHLRNVFIKTGVSSRGELIGLGLPTRSADV